MTQMFPPIKMEIKARSSKQESAVTIKNFTICV